MAKHSSVLFLGLENARASVLAESMLRQMGGGAFRAHSAGSRPSGSIDPDTLAFLKDHGYPCEGLRSKSWDEFADDGAPALDIVVTLSNRLIGEICPVFWTGRPVTTHWPLPENAGLDEMEPILARRIGALTAPPLGEFDAIQQQMRLDAIDRS